MESTMVERKMAKRGHEPIVRGGDLDQVDVEDYIEAMVRSEKLAAEKMQWSEQEWATHCLHQKAEAERRKAGKLKRGHGNG